MPRNQIRAMAWFFEGLSRKRCREWIMTTGACAWVWLRPRRIHSSCSGMRGRQGQPYEKEREGRIEAHNIRR